MGGSSGDDSSPDASEWTSDGTGRSGMSSSSLGSACSRGEGRSMVGVVASIVIVGGVDAVIVDVVVLTLADRCQKGILVVLMWFVEGWLGWLGMTGRLTTADAGGAERAKRALVAEPVKGLGRTCAVVGLSGRAIWVGSPLSVPGVPLRILRSRLSRCVCGTWNVCVCMRRLCLCLAGELARQSVARQWGDRYASVCAEKIVKLSSVADSDGGGEGEQTCEIDGSGCSQ